MTTGHTVSLDNGHRRSYRVRGLLEFLLDRPRLRLLLVLAAVLLAGGLGAAAAKSIYAHPDHSERLYSGTVIAVNKTYTAQMFGRVAGLKVDYSAQVNFGPPIGTRDMSVTSATVPGDQMSVWFTPEGEISSAPGSPLSQALGEGGSLALAVMALLIGAPALALLITRDGRADRRNGFA